MRDRSTRRQALLTIGTAGIAGLAGCASIGGSDEEDDAATEDGTDEGTTTESSGSASMPPWRNWVPADAVVSGDTTTVGAFDIDRMLTEFPEYSSSSMDIEGLASTFGIDKRELKFFVALEQGYGDPTSAMLGSFDPAAILNALGRTEAETTTYRGFQVLEETIAFNRTAIVVGPKYETMIRTQAGENEYLGANDDEWAQLLSKVEGSTIQLVKPGAPSHHDLEVEKSGMKIDPVDGGAARMTEYLHFRTESAAERAAEDRATLVDEALEEGDELVGFERDGRRLIIVADGDLKNLSETSE